MVENEQQSQLKNHALEVFRKTIDNLKISNISAPSGYLTDEGVWRTLYDDVSDLLDNGDFITAAKIMVAHRNLAVPIAIEVIEEDYNYSSSDIGAIERGEIIRLENAQTIIYLETHKGFLPDEIRMIIRGRDQYGEVLRSNLGNPRYYSKEPQNWRLKEILLFTAEGIKAVKVEDKISKLMQDAIQGLSDLNREDWMRLTEDIHLQGTTTDKLSRLVQPLNRAELLRREFLKELPSVFSQHVSTQSGIKAGTLLSTIKSFEPVNLFVTKFDLDPMFDAHFSELSTSTR